MADVTRFNSRCDQRDEFSKALDTHSRERIVCEFENLKTWVAMGQVHSGFNRTAES